MLHDIALYNVTIDIDIDIDVQPSGFFYNWT